MFHNVSLELKETGSELHEELQKSISKLEEDRRSLRDTEEQLAHSQNSKTPVNGKVRQAISRLKGLCSNVQKIAEEKSTEMQLQFKQRECQLLSEIKEALQEENIKRDMKRKESDLESSLESSQKEAQILQTELSQAQAELMKKCEEEKQRRKEIEKLTSSCNIEREKVNILIQLMVAHTSEIKVCIYNL